MSKIKMKSERFYLRKGDPVITADMLTTNPDKYGGLGIHMLNAIRNGVITIPLVNNPDGECGSCVSIQTCSSEDAERIIRDNGVEIQAEGYWCSILSTRPVFVGTQEPIRMWGVTVGDSIEKVLGK
jgi:hypothetical protein